MTKTLNNLRYPKLDIADGLKTSHTERVWNSPFYRCSVIRKRIKEGFYVEIECVLYLRFLKLLKLKHLKSLRSQDGPQAGWDPLGTHHIAESIERGVNRVGEEAIRLTDALDTSTVRMQGISNQITSTLMSFIETVTPEMRQANNTFAKVAHEGITVDMLAPLLALLNDPIKCIGALAVLYVFVEIVEHKYELPNLKYVKVILGTIALFRSPSALKKLFVNWIKVDTILAQPQSDWSDWAQVLVQGVLFAALGCTLDFNSLTNSVKNLVSAATNASKLQELFNSICDWFKNVCNLAASSMGLELFEWMKPQETVLKKFIVRVNELTATYTADPMAINVEYVNDVSRLLMEVNDYMITVPINSKNTPVHNAIKNLQDKISMLHKAVIDAGMNIGERYEPALLTEAGAAGCGKTFLREFNLQDFSMALADTVEDVVETSRNWKTKIYSWPIDPKHHDQYRGQPIVSFPDLFCQTDAEGQVSEASSLVYMIGDQPHNMTAAEMSKKQRLWLLMILAYAQTNQIYLSRNMFKSIRNVEAVIRRLNRFGFYVNVTDKYTLKDSAGNPIIDPATKRIRGREHDLELYGQVDRTKVPVGTIPDDMYQYRRLDFGKGCFVDNKVYSRKQYVRMAIKHVKEMKDAGRLKKDMLAEHMAEVAMNRVNELNQEQGFEMQADFDVEEEILEDPNHVVIEGLPEKYVDPITQNNEKLERILKQDTLLTEKYEALMARKHNDLLEQCLAELELELDYETADEGDRMSTEAIPQMDNEEVSDDEMPVLETDDDDDEEDDETDSPVVVSDVSSVATPVPLVVERVNRDFFGEMGEVNAKVVKSKTQKNRNRAKILENKYSEITRTRISYEQYTTIVNAIQSCREQIELHTDRIRRDPTCLAATMGRQFDRFEPERGVIFKLMRDTVIALEANPVTGPLVTTLSVQQIFDFIKYDFDDINDKVIEMRFNYLFKDPVIASLNTAASYISNLYACIRDHPIVTGATGAVTAAAVYARQTLTDIFYSRLFQMGLELAVVTLISSTITFGVLILLDWAICSYLEGKAAKNKTKSLKNVAQSATTDTESVTEFIDKYMDNFAALYVVMYKPGETKKYQRHPCNVTFLGGMTAVIVHHAALGIEKLKQLCARDGRKLELVLIPFRGGEINKSTERVPIADFEFDLEGSEAKELALRDLAIIKFKGIRNRSALYKHIPPLEVMDWIKTKTNLEGKFIERPVGEDLIISGTEKRTDVWMNFGGPNARYVGSVEYRGDTYEFDSYLYPSFKLTGIDKEFVSVKGYCTSPCFIIDSRKNVKIREWSRANMPWFAYLHTSLQRQVANGVPLFSELFEKWTKNIKNQKPVVDNVRETMKAYTEIIAEELELVADEGQSDILEITTKFEKLDINHESVAEVNHKFYVPNKSEIKRSPLFGIDPVTRYPARMGKYIDKDGDLVSTMTVARTPCGANSVCLDGPIDEVIEQAMRRVYSDSALPVYRELLDFDSCLYGDMAYNLTGTNWQSSCGFFFRMMKDYFKTDWKAKAWMLGPDQKLKPQVYKTIKRLFDYHEAKLVKGERVVSLITDSIKDELLPKGKNGRLFCVYDFIYLLLCKRYFGAFAGWIFQNRVRNGIAIGVNPYSAEWGGIVEHLLWVSNKCLFLDHSKFDKNCLRKIMKCLLILCTMYYNDKGSEAEKIRELLFEEIVDSYHVVMVEGKMYIYGWGQGNTSGNFLTAILNSLINICYLYICSIIAWLATMGILFTELKALPTNPVDKALAYVVLGDDVAASVNDELLPGVHFNSIKTIAKSYLGLTITDELKSEGECPNFRSIEEGSFLGRRFVKIVFEGKIIWVGLLRMYSTIERVQWIKGLYAPEIEIDKIETCFLELSLGPREVFEKYVSRYTEAAVKAYRKYPRFVDYDTARKYILTLGNYTYTFDDFMNSEGNYMGPDIEIILQKLRNQEIARNFVDGFTAEIDALLDPGFSFGEGETIATEEVPREEPNEFPSLRRIVTENQEFKCSSEDAVAHSDWASCAPDDRPHKKRKVVEIYEEVDMSMDVEAQNCNVEVEFEWAEPQMDSTDFEAGITMEKESLTTFIEAGSEIKGTSTQSTRKTSTYIETDADIKSFLQRPQLVAGAAWATTDVINANLETISLSALLASVPWWADKIKGFNLIRGDFMVKVMLNASPFQQGKLIAHYLPNQNNFLTTNPGYGSFKNKNLVQKVQHPHVEIDCRVTSSTMRIPYISPTSWYAQKEAIYDWGTFYLDVFSPLMTGAAAPGGQNHVDYSIYVWMENVELSAPAIPQSSSREVTVRNGIGESKENEGPIATGLRKVGKVANLLSSIPLVSDYAKTTEWVSNILSNAASSLGWSKPRELTGSTNVFQNMYRYLGTFDGPDVAQPGGLSVLNRLETIDYGSYTNADEMSTEFLYKIPYYVGEFEWDATDAIGSILYSLDVSPTSIVKTDADNVATHTCVYEYHVPFTYLARFFKYWRGSMKLTLKFIKTQMHSGRAEVVWIPVNTIATAATLHNSGYAKKAVVDLRTEDTVTFELPYMMYSDYLPTSNSASQNNLSGQISVTVVNALRAPESCNQLIAVQVFMTPGEDFELAVPGSNLASSIPYEPQADGTELVIDSVDQGKVITNMELGGKNVIYDGLFHAKRCIGEKFLSIKSLLLRNTVIKGPTGGSYTATNYLAIDPWYISVSRLNGTTGAQQCPMWAGDAFSLLAPCYAYFRGSIKYTVVEPTIGYILGSAVLPVENHFGTEPVKTTSALSEMMQYSNSIALVGPDTGYYPFEPVNYFDQGYGAVQHVPYYNKLPFTLTTYYNGVDTHATELSKPSSVVTFVKPVASWSASANFMRSVGDDFQLMFFTGCPPLARSYT